MTPPPLLEKKPLILVADSDEELPDDDDFSQEDDEEAHDFEQILAMEEQIAMLEKKQKENPLDANEFDEVVDETMTLALLSELTLDHSELERDPLRPTHYRWRIRNRTASGFLRYHGALVTALSLDQKEHYPEVLQSLLVKQEEKNIAQGYFLCLISDLAPYGTLFDRFLKVRPQHNMFFDRPEVAAWTSFSLLWSLYVAHTQTGLLFHGDIHSGNIVFEPRTVHHPARRIRYQLQSVNDPNQILAEWSFLPPNNWPEAKWIDFGHSSALLLDDPHQPERVTGYEFQNVTYHPPPELYFDQWQERDDRSDVWQMGLVLFSLLAKPPAQLVEIRRRSGIPGAPFTLEDRTLNEMSVEGYWDLVDLPMRWINALASVKNVPGLDVNDWSTDPLPEEEEELMERHGAEWVKLRPQVNVGKRFVAFLAQYPGLPVTKDFADVLGWDNDRAANKIERYLSIAMLQEALGNGWMPSLETATTAGYTESSFYQCLQHSATQTFWRTYVRPDHLRLYPLVRTMVEQIPEQARSLLKQMLAWNHRQRPHVAHLLPHPFFQHYLPHVPPTPPERVYRAPLRTPMRPNEEQAETDATAQRARIAERQRAIRERLYDSPVLDQWKDIEAELIRAVPRIVVHSHSGV